MIKKIGLKNICILFLLLCFSTPVFCQSQTNTTPQPYTQEEFPQLMKDLRRFEIITFGSMPFVTMDAAIAYNGYKYFSGKTTKFNLLATADYSPDEMKKIIITSFCVSAGIGITDYVVRLVKRTSTQKKNKLENNNIKIEEDPLAVKIPIPEKTQEILEETE